MKKIKYILILLVAVMLTMTSEVYCATDEKELNDNVDDQLDYLDTSELEDYLNGLSDSEKELFGEGSFKEKVQAIISGDFKIGYSGFFDAIFGLFFKNILTYIPIFSSIGAICIICGLITQLKPSFLSEGTTNIIFFVTYSSILLLVLSSLFSLFQSVYESINSIKTQMDISFPILLTLMAASGGNVSVSVYQPAVAFLSSGIVQLFFTVVLPITALIIIFCVVGNMSDNIKLNKFIDLFKSINKWVIGLSLTVFTVFLSVQGITSASYDGISFRAAKYAIGNSVPIIGGFLKDGFDLILASSVLIKNAVGSGCIILLAGAVIVPLVEIAAYNLFLKLTAAVIEPVNDSKIATFLSSLSSGINYLTASLLAIAFMYFITIMLLVCSSNSFF